MNSHGKIALTLMIALAAFMISLSSGSDFTLRIFGNANMDDKIDENDIAYVEGVIKETNAATNLSDADYDGKVDENDTAQIKLILAGDEKKLTIIDNADRIVQINMPVERFIPLNHRSPQVMLALGARDKIVGIDTLVTTAMPEFGLKGLPEVSRHGKELDYEKIIQLKTDLIVMTTSDQISENADKLPNVAVIDLSCMDRETLASDLKTIGYVLGKQKEAEEIIEWVQKYEKIVEERTENLTPEEMPRFLLLSFMTKGQYGIRATTPNSSRGLVAEDCGGRNIAAELIGSEVEIDPEWVIRENPDVIFITPMENNITGIGKTEEDLKRFLTQTIANFPEFKNVTAVKNNRIYLLDFNLFGPRWIIGNCYYAKWLHPDRFKDIHPDELHKEYLRKFHNLEVEGTMAYPPSE